MNLILRSISTVTITNETGDAVECLVPLKVAAAIFFVLSSRAWRTIIILAFDANCAFRSLCFDTSHTFAQVKRNARVGWLSWRYDLEFMWFAVTSMKPSFAMGRA